MAQALYDTAEFFAGRCPGIVEKTAELVSQELAVVMPQVAQYRRKLEGRKAAVYVGGAFKAFSLVRALRQLGMSTLMVGSQTGLREDYEELRDLCDEGTIIVDDSNPLELSAFLQEKEVDLFIGGVKERPIAYKLGVGFCDHNHERKQPLAGFLGMLNFAREVYNTVASPVWKLTPRGRKREMARELS
jgi:nitrogenase molybdenum-cofactor synthesis protein NifE